MTAITAAHRRDLVPTELRRASRAYLDGQDAELEDALRTALALVQGHRKGLT